MPGVLPVAGGYGILAAKIVQRYHAFALLAIQRNQELGAMNTKQLTFIIAGLLLAIAACAMVVMTLVALGMI